MTSSTNDGFGLVLVMVFAALFFGVIFLFSRRRSKGFLGNRFLLYGATATLVIFFVAARGQLMDFYHRIFKESPYDFAEFKSVNFQFGPGDSLVNRYNSATGEYQYLDRANRLKTKQLFLNNNDLLFLHRKAAEAGFWDFPAKELGKNAVQANGVKPINYLIEFDYQHGSKKVLFSTDFDGPPQLVEANRELITTIQNVISGAEDRQKK